MMATDSKLLGTYKLKVSWELDADQRDHHDELNGIGQRIQPNCNPNIETSQLNN